MVRPSIYRRALVTGASLIGLVAATPSLAQQTQPTGEPEMVDEIIVTARRREETLTDVPISITVQTGDQLAQRGAQDITALQRTTPNLTLQVSRGTNSTLTAFIRGIGQQDPLWGFEPGVGLYVDDVYIARPQGAVLDLYDVERVEVLRGPQGTLYGRNTIGGAVRYVTRPIDQDDPHFRARAAYGSYNQRDLVVSGSLPLTERLAVSAAVGRFLRDGFGENHFTGGETYNRDVTSARMSVEFRPTDALFLRLSGDILQDNSNANHGHRERPVPLPLAGLVTPACRGVLPNVYDTCAGLGDRNEVNTAGLALSAEWLINDTLTFKSITAYREGSTVGGGIDFDNTPAPILDIAAGQPNAPVDVYADDQFSQEFQLLYEGDRMQGVVGLYYFDSNARGQFDTILAAAGITQGTSGSVDTTSFALFGDVSFDLTDRLAVSVGGRWTQDDRSADVFKANYAGLGSPISGRVVAPFAILTDYSAERTFEEFTPRISATYELTPEINLYAAYGRGFKSGGFDMRGDAAATPSTVNGYDPEIVDSYEVGLRGSLFDRRVWFSTAVFHAAYEGQQITTQRVNAAGTSVVSFVENVGSSTITGWEFEGRARLTDRLSANVALGYVDAEFNEFLSYVPNPAPPPAFVQQDVADQRQFQNTPSWTGNLTLTYDQPFAGGDLIRLIGSMSFRSDSSMFETPFPDVDQPGYELYDVGVLWMPADTRWRVALHGRNMTDERYRTGAYTFAYVPAAPSTLIFGDSVIGFYGPPRTFTLSVEYDF
ncbi:TonB-dependent receptor [Brevundimonas aveniformis]|uniref:TonB-dependent receptor n=1 Tax=Brevundimonas aveniformis TaxID=370977 RepID=UPI00249216DA|nr:TonB-dependent receptor [Brevundimonas aveniformis]